MISSAQEQDHSGIIDLWEQSVRATHHFLPEDYLQEIKTLLPGILPMVSLYVYRDDDNIIKGFAGVDGNKIEMLFIHPASRGKGIGSLLTKFCIHELKTDKVDVNEQNEAAAGFYKIMGFKIMGRQELDGMGRPYPILQMKLP